MKHLRRGLIAAFLTPAFACGYLAAQQEPCEPDGYRVVTRDWDPVLKRAWELRQQCGHPERPMRLAAGMTDGSQPVSSDNRSRVAGAATPDIAGVSQLPLLVKAGDSVRMWMRDELVKIEMMGIVERSAHRGEQVIVQITRQDDETGLTVQRIAGTVSGPDEVEMER